MLVLRIIFPHHLLIKFWMSVWEERYSPSWMVFPDIIRFRSNLRINIKQISFVLWVHLHTEKMPFGLKNVWANSQCAMNFSFHELKWIIEVYLDDLATHSHLRVNHLNHLCLVFERFHLYQIRLIPQKCIFCLKVGCLLGFIISKEGIRVDPLKVEVIIQLTAPCNIRHL